MKFNISCNSLLTPMRILEDELEKLDIGYVRSKDGYLEVHSGLPQDQRKYLERSLARYSVSIIEDEREALVQRIKDLLFQIVHSEKQLSQTLSCYLTEKLGYSYGYLSGVFVGHTFSSIEQYLILLKVEKAKRMIIEDAYSLKQISDLLCYSSLGHFSKQFKKVTGITLTEFRKIIIRRKNGDN